MGNKQPATTNGTTDEYANDTAQSALSPEDLAFIDTTAKLSAKYFGGEAIAHDASMHQMQQDLLSFDETIKNLFFRRKTTTNESSNGHEYYDQQPTDSTENQNYNQSIPSDGNIPPSLSSVTDASNNNKLIWRCTYCTAENKITEQACRRCRQAETKL
jgi:ribosomal protein L40E